MRLRVSVCEVQVSPRFAREKVSVWANGHGVSHHRARGYGVSLWADGAKVSLLTEGYGVPHHHAHTYGVYGVRAHAISLARTL